MKKASVYALLSLSTLGSLEILFRFYLFSPLLDPYPRLGFLRKAGLFASDLEDDYWRMGQRWYPLYKFHKDRIHPYLGWSQEVVTPENRLGLKLKSRNVLETHADKLLFYGDSFVGGKTSEGYRLPSLLEGCLHGYLSVDLGVGGYGLDQIYMLFHETKNTTGKKIVLVGVLSDDLDRSGLGERNHQKPRFLLHEGKLVLTNTPIDGDPERRSTQWRLRTVSYLTAAFKNSVKRLLGFSPLGEDEIRKRKEVNEKLLERFISESKKEKAKLYFILFYEKWEVEGYSPRLEFLKAFLRERGANVIDTRLFLRAYEKSQRRTFYDLYAEEDGHHGDLGNKVIAAGICSALRGDLVL